MVKTFLKIIWWRFLVPRSEHLLVSSATLSSKTQNILTLSMLVYCNTKSFFLRSFSLMQWLLVCSGSLVIKVFSELHCFMSFIVSCCSLILLLPNIISLEELFRYGTSISRYVWLVLGSLLINIFSTAPALPALIVLRALADLLEYFLKSI